MADDSEAYKGMNITNIKKLNRETLPVDDNGGAMQALVLVQSKRRIERAEVFQAVDGVN